LKKYKSPDSNQILADLIQAEGEILFPAIQTFLNSVSNKEILPVQWNDSGTITSSQKGWQN
jgi:hypothetical protein